MVLVILAGGQRSTISEERENIPKPMLEIGGRPLLWHIMKHASECGIRDFIVCGGYKIDIIKNYFLNFYIYQSDIRVNTFDNSVEILKKCVEDWNVTIVDTGVDATPTERIHKIRNYISGQEFMVTYGDCLTDIPYQTLCREYFQEKKRALMAITHPNGRKMPLIWDDENQPKGFGLEGNTNNAWVSGGVFVFHRDVPGMIETAGDIEDSLIPLLIGTNQLALYRHQGFWMSVETLRDKAAAEKLWLAGKATWIER